MKQVVRLAVVLGIASISSVSNICHEALAQPSCSMPITRSWIHLTETYGFGWDTLWFGFDSSATYGIDPHLCEFELPYLDYQFLFVNIPGHIGLGNGLLYDFRRFFSETQVDSHRIGFGVNWPTVYTFHWSPSSVRTICDSAVLIDKLAGLRVRLDLIDSVYSTSEVFSNFIIRYGAKRVQTYVEAGEKNVPTSAQLFQNYPNPFNPSTMINYRLAMSSYVTLKVFDVLGREAATLISGRQKPGEHSVEWRPGGVPSGVYSYRLTTSGTTITRKMLLLR